MSRDIVDVIDKIEGEMRIEKYPNYWQPLLNTYDSSSISFSELYKYMIVDTDQLNIKYNFSDENCQKFAKIVFDKIARNKTWNYVTFLQKSRGKNRAKGFEWSEMIRYYSGDIDQDDFDKELDILMKHINNDTISSVRLYTTPLSEDQWTNLIFYHAYVVFNTETYTGTYWWSLEKNGEALILQMSRNIEDVRDKIEGQSRIEKYPNYWKPLFNTGDISSISFSELYKYMIEDTEQLNIKYNFSDENCKKFAKIVFDKIARNKKWNYVPVFDIKDGEFCFLDSFNIITYVLFKNTQ